MSISHKINILKKWINMINGKSVLHIEQKKGLYYKKNEIHGYYSDLRHKVIQSNLLSPEGVPLCITNTNKEVYFSIAIFQYGLGAYDLYLETLNRDYLIKFKKCLDWALENQESSGAWNSFYFYENEEKYSSMAQGEGASLLIRGFIEFNDNRYLDAAQKAIDFMLIDKENGGVARYVNDDIFFEEYTNNLTVLNGWIFSLWGLYDYSIISGDKKYKEICNSSVTSLAKNLKKYDRGFWSNYDLNGNITSPFYHSLHLSQLEVMKELFEENEFEEYLLKWTKYKENSIYRILSFIVKAYQKLKDNKNKIVIVK